MYFEPLFRQQTPHPSYASFIPIQQNFVVPVFPIIRVHITWHMQGIGSSLKTVSTSGLWGLFWENSLVFAMCITSGSNSPILWRGGSKHHALDCSCVNA